MSCRRSCLGLRSFRRRAWADDLCLSESRLGCAIGLKRPMRNHTRAVPWRGAVAEGDTPLVSSLGIQCTCCYDTANQLLPCEEAPAISHALPASVRHLDDPIKGTSASGSAECI
ncbi:unnamed protein product [Effrenium voratum]|nr:unnamed protein product [Effrenium voratum]